MNEKKAKVGMNATSIVGLVFTIIGAIFLVLGIALGIGLRSELGMESIVFYLHLEEWDYFSSHWVWFSLLR